MPENTVTIPKNRALGSVFWSFNKKYILIIGSVGIINCE